MPPSATPMPLFRLSFQSAATPACRWKRAAPSRITTKRATFWKCTAPPKCRTGIATPWRKCLAGKEIPSTSTKAMSAAASAFAAKFIRGRAVCAAALKFRKPIKWIEDRREHLIAANHSRQQHHKIRAAIDAEGHILGIDNEFFHDNAPTCARTPPPCPTSPQRCCRALCVPAYRTIGHIRLTNKTPCGTYRAPAVTNPPLFARGYWTPSPPKWRG